MSEQGSLHSMHSHLSPYSGRSSESAPASRRGLSGSTSSRPSAHSQMLSASSGGSLMTGSLSSHGRRAAGGAISPALSAFGRTDIEEGDEADNAQRVSVLGPMPSFALSTNHPPTIRSVGTVGTSTATTTTTGSEETEVLGCRGTTD
ncbi:hypothetical protein SERLADRAFT_468884 [Serpula lacrymans var. lacrymans S7.9]|uniref:Uncharacterized protein n=1 Tax=Serpula lacrymans var. lacrymans (strain S7.9) TaxID=578457 RepID=F8NVY1_SERL9|nr:uncharacterized protein SERLADRAFT_468884 [Serpula lacrymans var. lacrymans S7.9]EGO24915.1 hypothetical protein SERLADRAFT_468884 [Serpula lacrymans var. lacrymans S7.9]